MAFSYKVSLGKVSLIAVALHVLGVSGQLLGAGTGVGSCRAFPYRVEEVDWEVCPVETACCNEYGYCRTREEWNNLKFRDCNGKSNGIDLPLAVLNQESASGGIAGEALGAEKTFDISQVGNGVYGVGGFGISSGSSEFGTSNGNELGPRRGSNEFSGSGSNGFSGSNQNRYSGSGSNGSGEDRFSGSGSNDVSKDGSNRFSGSGSNGISGTGSNRVSGSGEQRGSNRKQGQDNSQARGSAKRGSGKIDLRGSGPSSGNRRFGSTGGAKMPGKNQGGAGSGGEKPGRGKNNNKSKNSGKSKGSESFNTDTGGSGFPLVGYENTAGFPMNLNRQNCPKYPFCWWNPYQNKNRG